MSGPAEGGAPRAEGAGDAGAPSVEVRVPAPLRHLTGGAAAVEATGETVGAALRSVARRHPQLRRHLFAEDGSIREYVNVFLNSDDIRQGGGEAMRVRPDDVVTIVPSIAGG